MIEFGTPAFWVALLQIIGVNIILSGDNAVVIAMACMTLPPKQRLWGMVLGAGVAVGRGALHGQDVARVAERGRGRRWRVESGHEGSAPCGRLAPSWRAPPAPPPKE